MSNCIEHKQKGDKAGYGRLNFKGKLYSAHRTVYMRTHNLEPDDIDGMVVMHKCDNPRCINPEHLELGTHKDNTQDMLTKGRNKPTRKLSSEEVRFIRKHYKFRDKEYSGVKLATMFGVDKTTISNIILRKCYINED